MKTLFRISSSLIFILGLSQSAFADSMGQQCQLSKSSAQTPPFVPVTGTNKALIIFVQFNDDDFGSDTTAGGALCTTDPVTEWPYDRGDLPAWAFDVIDETDTGTHTPNSITDYFCKMSRDRNDGAHGKFHLVGQVYSQLIVPENLLVTMALPTRSLR